MVKIAIILVALTVLGVAGAEDNRTFPEDFMFGTGTSAYQTEGAWNKDEKTETIWDRWVHDDPTRIKNNDTADDAVHYYENYLEPVMELDAMEVKHFRFSIPWTRILPTGFTNEINLKAIAHYQLLIEALLLFDVIPVVTIYYHDLPQSLQDIGGWTNPKMVKYFADYARICFQYFPDINYWITFNDPAAICRKGYGDGTFAPGIKSDGVGKVSIAIDVKYSVAASEEHLDAVGLYTNPIYKGNWPDTVIERVAFRSKGENLTKSRLPEFTKEEIDYINGTSDFMSVNLYHTHFVEDAEEAEFGDPSYMKDMKAKVYLNSSWTIAENGQAIVPLSARKALIWMDYVYNPSEILITENGVPDSELYSDNTRIEYYRDYLNAVLDAILIDRVKIIGYTAWSFIDGFEWTEGYR
ncbi:hypothetical protein NQ315_006878 [Exocentrus adspersus]|uniref:Myrosinase 1-like n=1 Tax=Exocentrus adspersus TaxID=1586481 RepID=A0AAV8WCW9_9CUCU|nr:hypothetical protein NQ315_006878 [Exocentrus adspersus]